MTSSEPVSQTAVRLDALAVFSLLFSIHVLFSTIYGAGELAFWRAGVSTPHALERIATAALAFAALAQPRSLLLLLAMMAGRLADYAASMPVASNNFTMSAFAALALLFGAAYVALVDGRVSRVRLSQAFVPVARDLLLLMYFYGVFHKLNADFVNPSVSCAVAIYKPLAVPFALQNWIFGQYLAIYSTFVIESLAIVLLLSRRWKYWGFVIGMPFHLIIGVSGYAFYMDFSLLCLSLYALFLPPEYFRRLNQTLVSLGLGRLSLRMLLLGLGMVSFVAILSLGRMLGTPRLVSQDAMLAFALLGGAFYVSILWFCPIVSTEESSVRYLSPVLAILPLLFLVNGMSPYIGFKTESSIAMFSNLRTEGGRSNHFLFRKLPYLFSYQNQLVTLVASSAPELRQYIGPNRQLVQFELGRMLAEHRDAGISFVSNGRLVDHLDPVDNVYANSNWFLRQLLIFKPVDWTEPKPCTH
jgi:hypothetical protein